VPAAVQGTEEEKLAAFRHARNKIAAHIDTEFGLVEGRKA